MLTSDSPTQPFFTSIRTVSYRFPAISQTINKSPTRRAKFLIEIGHRSTNCSLLGMLSMKLGRSVQWDGEKELILNDSPANKLLSREYRKPGQYPRG
jgi:hypothetical protein